jgi:hypothetical protein
MPSSHLHTRSLMHMRSLTRTRTHTHTHTHALTHTHTHTHTPARTHARTHTHTHTHTHTVLDDSAQKEMIGRNLRVAKVLDTVCQASSVDERGAGGKVHETEGGGLRGRGADSRSGGPPKNARLHRIATVPAMPSIYPPTPTPPPPQKQT